MAVYFSTTNPQSLLQQFDQRIAQADSKGKITTWEKSSDGLHYMHKAAEWRHKAWFKASIERGRLTFNIVKPQNATISVPVYGYYHGHLVETFLNHFDNSIGNGIASAYPEGEDVVK